MVLDHRHHRSLWLGIIGLGVVLFSGCRPDQRKPPANSGAAIEPADSLALSDRGRVEVWFTLARTAHGSDGKQCLERGLEIRRDGRRVPVPLLYTGETPTLLNDTTIRAVLWTHCKPVDPYLVDLRTGRPVREHRAAN
jgi:hypothetical protein